MADNQKQTFKWEIKLLKDEAKLQLDLNEGVNRIISIHHEDYYKNLSDLLLEIIHYEYGMGMNTELNPRASQAVHQANEMHESWKENLSKS